MNPIKSIGRTLGTGRATETRVAVEPSLWQQVWSAPATFNRHTRRAHGILSRIWRWDLNTPGMQRAFVPRYIRRHIRANTLDPHIQRTRRERRHRARIIRAMAWKGIKP